MVFRLNYFWVGNKHKQYFALKWRFYLHVGGEIVIVFIYIPLTVAGPIVANHQGPGR